MYTSLSDYQKWSQALRTNKLLDLEAVLSRTKFAMPQKTDSFYAAGWFFRQPSAPVLFHSGSTCGFNNYVVSIPSKQFLMVYFSNRAENKVNAVKLMKLLAKAGYSEPADILPLDDLTQ
ncbi:serine hydrolase [Spirosoma sp. KNUC1025]|uniref:serine hydrolase n=1 Tax=Spirosoma sp. KNUC1025 TaxID=2894082 RepID=UPI003863F65C